MMTYARASLFAALFVVACGGKDQPPPATPVPGGDANDVYDAGDTSPADEAASADAGPTAAATGGGSEPATASAATAAPAPAAPSEPEDECTPVGVDFEKRARPKIKECYRKAKEKTPDLKGTIRIAVDIDGLGKVRGTKITEKTLPDPVASCMLAAVKGTPLPEAAKCPGKTLTIPVSFPTQ